MHAIALVAALGLLGSAAAARDGYAVKDELNPPRKWSRVGPAPKDKIITLHIGLKQPRFDELEQHLWEVSDPDHQRYGDHLSAAEVNELVAPSHEAVEKVHAWLEKHGIQRNHCGRSPAGDWISANLRVDQAERLLDTDFSTFRHRDGRTELVRTPRWSLPESLHEHVDTVQPTNSFMRALPKIATFKPVSLGVDLGGASLAGDQEDPSVAKVCNVSSVTPLCLRTLYGTLDYKPKVPGKNRIGLNNFLGESNNRSDVRIFLSRYRPDAVAGADAFKFVSIDGGTTEQTLNETELEAGTDLEGNLDAETIIGITYPTPLTAFSTGGSPPFVPDDFTPTDTNEPYLAWLQYVLAQPDGALPQVISTSYADDEQSVPRSYAAKACRGFAQLGVRGVSLFFGSGDEGVGESGDCFSNDGKNRSTFLPEFPSSCPYVTTVGATKGFDPEVAALDPLRSGRVFTSGGGFSEYFPRPGYQDAAVRPYLKALGSTYKGLYNPRGRAYPDLSAQGQKYVTIWNGSIALLDGTSASTPTTASIFSLVNDALIAHGRKPLGFLNPWLYKYGYRALNDVTSGSAAGCNVTGFQAAKGWDAVTGFGTPNFPKILKLLGI